MLWPFCKLECWDSSQLLDGPAVPWNSIVEALESIAKSYWQFGRSAILKLR